MLVFPDARDAAGLSQSNRRRLASRRFRGINDPSPTGYPSFIPRSPVTLRLRCGCPLPLPPPPWGSLKTKEAHHDEDRETQRSRSNAVHWVGELVPARPQPQHPVYRRRAKHVADEGGAYWLLDTIAICQRYEKPVAAEAFQAWKLVVRSDRTATLTCEDGNYNVVYTQQLEFTDFPVETITLWFENNVIYLPSER